MRYELTIASVIFVTLLNTFFSINIINKNNLFYTEEIDQLTKKTEVIQLELDEFIKYGIEVDVTMYQPLWPQTDKTPNITADGTHISISRASEYKFVALSRNLLKRWGGPFDYGDYILIKGADHKDGIYQVRDTMNSKWVNMVDILESVNVKPYKYADAQIFKTSWIIDASN